MALSTDNLARVEALARYKILDTLPEPAFDDIVMLASQICETPVALVSLVADDRQWFKARIGIDAHETSLDKSVCVHALDHTRLLVISDLMLDERTRDNPSVTGPPHLRFYAGAPLRTAEGCAVGTVCVLDHLPRPMGLHPAQATSLEALARQVMAQLELRHAMAEVDSRAAALREGATRLRTIFQTTYQYQGLLARDGTVLDANKIMLRAIGSTLDDVAGLKFWETPWFTATAEMPPRVREWVERAASGETVREEIEVVLPSGRRVFDLAMRPVPDEKGGVVGIVPEAVDLTERRAAEDQLRQIAEDGSGRPAHRRHRARLQQHAGRRHRRPEPAGAPARQGETEVAPLHRRRHGRRDAGPPP